MPGGRFAPLVVGLVLSVASPAQAQRPQPLAATPHFRFESWRVAAPKDSTSRPTFDRLGVASRNRTGHALLGGAIGAAAGVVFCTVVSTLANDSAEGRLSFCPLDSYLLIGGAGFVLGAAIGWTI
jgi:hypothetical protein